MSNYETTTNNVHYKDCISSTICSIIDAAVKNKNGDLILLYFPAPDYSWFYTNGTKSNGVK